MPETLKIEIVAYAPTAFFHCAHCEVVWDQVGFSQGVRNEQLQSGLPEELRQEYHQLSEWVRQLMRKYGDQIEVSVIDAASAEGFVKSLRHRVRRFPAVIVGGRERVTGGNYSMAEQAIALRLAPPAGG
mgnify:CR=1 FL=1